VRLDWSVYVHVSSRESRSVYASFTRTHCWFIPCAFWLTSKVSVGSVGCTCSAVVALLGPFIENKVCYSGVTP